MAVTNIPNVQNWTVTPQNGQPSYFTLMNTWLGQSTLVIASLQTAIAAQNIANNQINELAIKAENNAIIATGLANFQGAWSGATTYSKGQSVESTSGSKIYYTSKVDNNLNHAVTDTNYWLYNPINNKLDKDFLRSTNITVNVGAGQTYTTINQALEYLSGFYPMYKKSGITAAINLKAGFVMSEQVLVSGIDLGWITIVGEDAETIITHTALTIGFNGPNYPAFGVDKGGTSPIIGQLFRFNVEKAGEGKHGLMTYGAGSSADVLPGKGFIGAGSNGIYAGAGSTINADSANCSNAGSNGIYADFSSTINAPGANCSNAKSNGIYAGAGSTISAYSANCSNAGSHGIYAVSASIIDALSANCSNAKSNGIYAGAGSTINADSANCSNAGSNGIYADFSSTINAPGANCSNAKSNGIYAGAGSTISAYSAIIQNQTTGTARIRVVYGSHINAFGVNTTGGTVPVFSQAVNTITANGIIYQ